MANRPWEPEYEVAELTPTRQAIGQRTQMSLRDQPQFDIVRQVLAGELVAAREALKAAGANPLPTYNDYLVKLLGLCLREFPLFNSWIEGSTLKLLRPVNVGFACDTPAGLLLPTVFEADTKSLAQIAAETRELVAAAREGKLRASLQKGAGFTLSNIGPTGVEQFNAIISPPQTAILAVGSLAERPVAEGGEVRVAPTLYLTLTVDHQVHDGATGARFLGALADRLQDGALLRGL